MSSERSGKQGLFAAGILVALAGMICVGGGITLLAWRILNPAEAVLLPPGAITTPDDTPTPGILGVPVAPPPLPVNAAAVVILPVSKLPTVTPTPQATSTATRTATLTATRTPTITPSDTPTTAASISPESPASPMPSASPTPTHTLTVTHPPTATAPHTATPPPPAADRNEPDRLIIEKIGLNVPVVPVGQHPIWIGNEVYSQWDVPDNYAAGWHQNSAPLGTAGNIVINGHHNVNGAVFYYLTALAPGDLIVLEAGEKRYKYIIAQTMLLKEEGQPLAVRQENARWILPTADERVTLITCWPLEASTHRYIVIALSVNALDQLTGIP